MNTLDIRSLLQVTFSDVLQILQKSPMLVDIAKEHSLQDDAIEHVDMEEETGKDVEEVQPEAASNHDEGDEVSSLHLLKHWLKQH